MILDAPKNLNRLTIPAFLRFEKMRLTSGEWIVALLFLLPALLHFGLFKYYPVLYSFALSLHRGRLLDPFDRFLGAYHYTFLLQDSYFWQGIQNALLYTIARVPVGAAISLALALLLMNNYTGRLFFRVAWYVPVVISSVAQVQIFIWLYNPEYGILNYLLTEMGFSSLMWLGHPNTALLSLILLGLWGSTPFTMIIYMAALGSIPNDYYEAAEIDGANAWNRFWQITLPLLMPTTFFVLITQAIGALTLFEPVYLMTGGGPLGSTTMPGYQIYEAAFEFNLWGRGSALAVIFFIIVLSITMIQYKYTPESYTQ
ncbi:ABC transporter permease subunit [bacterium]|nr:ABC transporter permease subunit [bacterium]